MLLCLSEGNVQTVGLAPGPSHVSRSKLINWHSGLVSHILGLLCMNLTQETHHLWTRLKTGQWDPGKDFFGGGAGGHRHTCIYIGKKLMDFFCFCILKGDMTLKIEYPLTLY